MSEAGTDVPTGPDLRQGVPLVDIPATGALAGHVDGEPVLLSRGDGEFFAVSGVCTHYGAPLAEGHVVGETVRCPWHHACFSLRTGIALKAPAFAPLDRWQVEVEQDRAFVRAKLPRAEEQPVTGNAPARIVIVGGGAAGFAAAEMLRRLGFAGSLTVLSDDSAPPTDRPNLSKDYLAGDASPDWIPLQGPDFYEEQKIDLRVGSRIAAIETGRKQVVMADGTTIPFDALLIATGAEPTRLPLPGFDRPNVHTLRTLADADRIIALAEGGGAVALIGAGFISLEAAAALRHRGLDVHIVAPDPAPMGRILGEELGGFIRTMHEQHGVHFHLGRTPASYDDERLLLDNGDTVPADFVLVGVGVKPRIGLAAEAGLATGNGILVDSYLETNVPGIYAAGDVANYPHPLTGERVRTEHWVVALRQGQAAARNMLGDRLPYRDVPFFWTRQYDHSVHYVGYGGPWDRAEVSGSVADADCSVFYRDGGWLRAAAFVGRAQAGLKEEARLEAEIAKGGG